MNTNERKMMTKEWIAELRKEIARNKATGYHDEGIGTFDSPTMETALDALEAAQAHIARLEARVGELEAGEWTAAGLPPQAMWDEIQAIRQIAGDDGTHGSPRNAVQRMADALSEAQAAAQGVVPAEGLAVLREIVRLVDEARERYDKRPRGAGGQRMPDEIDDLLCRLYEIALHFRTQATEGVALTSEEQARADAYRKAVRQS